MTTQNKVPDLIIPGPLSEEPQLRTMDTEKAEALNSFCISIFTKENKIIIEPLRQEVKYIIHDLVITTEDVNK